MNLNQGTINVKNVTVEELIEIAKHDVRYEADALFTELVWQLESRTAAFSPRQPKPMQRSFTSHVKHNVVIGDNMRLFEVTYVR